MINKAVIMLAGVASLISQPCMANGVGENVAWQFLTPAERAALMYLEEVRQRNLGGFYSAPIYNTYIDDNTYIDNQYNCSVNSTATGSESASNSVANSPNTGGHGTTATGNANDTTYDAGGPGDGSTGTSTQGNSGEVSAGASGSTSSSVSGDNFQTLNTDQVNSGNQSATVNGSSACQYADAG